jgi:hypothetical protein
MRSGQFFSAFVCPHVGGLMHGAVAVKMENAFSTAWNSTYDLLVGLDPLHDPSRRAIDKAMKGITSSQMF